MMRGGKDRFFLEYWCFLVCVWGCASVLQTKPTLLH